LAASLTGLLHKAEPDEAVLAELLRNPKFDDETVGFHAQQGRGEIGQSQLEPLVCFLLLVVREGNISGSRQRAATPMEATGTAALAFFDNTVPQHYQSGVNDALFPSGRWTGYYTYGFFRNFREVFH